MTNEVITNLNYPTLGGLDTLPSESTKILKI